MKQPSKDKPSCLYLIHGNNEVEVNEERYRLVCSLLTPEERDAGLTEIRGPGNMPLTLDNTWGDLMSELGTASFIEGARRVVVVYDMKEFFESRGGKSRKGAAPKKGAGSRREKFLQWLEEELPTTGNTLIFVCQENDERQRTVSQDSDLYTLISKLGRVIVKREKPLNFEFEDRLLSGNGPAALLLAREWIRRAGSDSSGRLRIYTTLAGVLELMLQARCLEEAKQSRIPEAQVRVDAFPSLTRLPTWKARKIETFARRFSMGEIHALIEKANRLQRYMYPTGDEDYVPPWEEHLEMIIMEMTMVRHG